MMLRNLGSVDVADAIERAGIEKAIERKPRTYDLAPHDGEPDRGENARASPAMICDFRSASQVEQERHEQNRGLS
jgi:hypothetical protein